MRRKDLDAAVASFAPDVVWDGVRSADLDELAGVKLDGQLFNVFTIRRGRIVHVRDFALRAQAQEAAGLEDLPGWR